MTISHTRHGGVQMLKVFITNVSSYNVGRLEGKWMTLPTTVEALNEGIKEVLAYGGEEYFISAFEGNFYVNEHVDLVSLNDILLRAKDDETAFISIMDCLTVHFDEGIQILEDGAYHMIPEVGDLKEAAEILVEEGYYGEIPDHLSNFLSYQAIANDMITAKGWKYSEKGNAAICRLR